MDAGLTELAGNQFAIGTPGDLTMKRLSNFLKNSKGATAIEYGLIAALIAVAAITAMSSLGGQLKKTFNNVTKSMAVG